MSAPDPFPINSRPDPEPPDSRETGPEQSPGETGTGRPARPRRVRPRPGQRLARPEAGPAPLTAEQRLLILDSWRRSGLPAGDFAPLVGVSKHTLYAWKQKFEAEGPAGLADQPRGGPAGSRLPEVIGRARRRKRPWSGSLHRELDFRRLAGVNNRCQPPCRGAA
jgi:hypothetical protein